MAEEKFSEYELKLLERLKFEWEGKGPLFTVVFQVDLETLLAMTAALGLALSHPQFGPENGAWTRVQAFVEATRESLIANELPAHAEVVGRNCPPAPIGDTAAHA